MVSAGFLVGRVGSGRCADNSQRYRELVAGRRGRRTGEQVLANGLHWGNFFSIGHSYAAGEYGEKKLGVLTFNKLVGVGIVSGFAWIRIPVDIFLAG